MRTSAIRGSSIDALYSTDELRWTVRSAASNSSSVAFSNEPLGSTSLSTGLEGTRGQCEVGA